MGLVVCCMKMLSFKRVWNVTSYPKRCIVLNPSCPPSLYNSLFTINKLLASSKIQLVRGDFQFVFSKIPPTYDVLYDVLYITQSGSLALICKQNYTVYVKLRWILKNKLLFKFSTSKKKLYANLSTYPWTEFTVPINFVPNSNQNRSNATNELVIMFHVAVDEAETSDNI